MTDPYADPTMVVMKTTDEGTHIIPWDEDAMSPVYGHRPAVDCPCGPLEQRMTNIINERHMIYYHDATYEAMQRVL